MKMKNQSSALIATLGQFTRTIVIFLLVLLLVPAAISQVITGDVLGTVTDSTGAIVPGATVTIKNVGTGISRTATTESNGEYTFNLLQPGNYTLSVVVQGFKPVNVKDFPLTSASRIRQDVQLQVGNANETVDVTGEAPLLQTDSSAVGSTINDRTTDLVPLNGRNITNLVTVQPGVTEGMPSGISAGARPDDRRQTSSVSANGQREYLNAGLLDGIDNTERYYGLNGIKPSVDAIQEVNVQTNSFSADIGRSGGAAVSIVTKSGTNNFHGSLYEFFRNTVLNAKDYFTPVGTPKAQWNQNQYGGSIGGPIWKNKAFFFFDVEQLRIVEGISSPLQLVPTNADRALVEAAPASVEKNVFLLYPAPNVGTNEYFSNPAKRQTVTTLDSKADYHFNSNNSIFGRYSYNPTTSFFPGFFPAAEGVQPAGAGFISNGFFPGTNETTAQGAQINYTHIFTPTLLMNLRVGFLRLNIDSNTINNGLNASSKLGIPNANLPGQPGSSGLTGVHFLDGYADLGDQIAYPIVNINNTYQLNGDVSWTKGKHDFKFGAAVLDRQVNYEQQFAPTGWMFYLDPVAMVLGNPFMPANGQLPVFVNRQNAYGKEYLRSWEPSFYAKDDWRVTPWLTFNLGVRYDIFTAFSDANNRLSNFDLNTLQIVVGGTGGVNTYYGNVAPRFGFAAQLPGNTVLRGGFGMTYYPGDYANAISLYNPPYNTPINCSPLAPPFVPGGCPAGTGSLSLGPPVAPPYVDPSIIYDPGAGGLTLNSKPSNFRAAYLEQYNLVMQKEFGNNVISVGYVGSLGRHQPMSGGQDEDLPYPSANGTYTLVDGAMPVYYPQLAGVSQITLYSNSRTSSYNSLQATFQHRYSHGLQLNANYTWAHGLNDWSGFESSGAPAQWRGNSAYDYGNSDLDVRQRFAMTFSWDVPWGKSLHGVEGAMLAHWGFSSSSYFQTGLPFTVVSGQKPTNAYGNESIKVNVVPGVSPYIDNKGPVNGWLNINAFGQAYDPSSPTAQTSFTLGDERTNQYYGPGAARFDLAAYKNFPIKEAMSMQFRAECYNLSNTPTFSQPVNDITQQNFGRITSTAYGSIPRVFQFALKFLF